MQQKWVRTVGAFAVASAIAIQLPMRGGSGVALANTEYPTGTGGGITEQLATVGTAAVVAYGVSTTTGSGIGAGLFAAASAKGLVQLLAARAAEFGELRRLIDLSGLSDALAAMDSPVTVFAPTNSAFAALPADDVAMLVSAQNRTKLSNLLQYHIVEGRYSISQLKALPDGTVLKTLNGDMVTITNKDGLKINGNTIGEDDIAFSSGWVHPIGGALTPPSANDDK
jgi:uncharacterized surface protein with fasciclin (FAS1) repeats